MYLVVGATGSLGGHIAHRLLKEGQVVRTLVREGSGYSKLQSSGAEVALGDLKNPKSLERGCLGVERIIATASAAARGGDDTVASVDRDGYAHLISAAERAGVKQFVFVSAHGFEADSPVALARAKVATERALEESGLNYTILRPVLFMEAWISMILGAQLQTGSKLTVIGDPDRPYSFVTAVNVADLALAVLGNPEAERTRIPLSAQAASYRQLTEWIGEATGRELSVDSVPPGTEIAGLPPIVLELWSWAATQQAEPIATVEVAVKFGLALESPKAYVDRTFRQPSAPD